jgi:23S rRNA (uracil1939-C5)-methyltransferase
MVGHAFGVDEPPVVPSPRQEAYRARIKLTLEGAQAGYRASRSHTLVPVDVCQIARPEVQQAHTRLLAWLERGGAAGLNSVELRSDGARVVYAFVSEGSVPREVRDRLPELGDVALDGRKVAGDPVLVLDVLGCRLQARPASFYQVNPEINAAMVTHVRDALGARGVERAVDLYAGIGNFSVPVAASGVPVVAVEAPGAAVDDLRANAVAGLEVHARRVERFDLSRIAYDGAIVDPPRAGTRGVLPRVARNRPRVIVYVSCNPTVAAREIRELGGYELADLTCFELFVDTRHIEAVVILERC